MLSPKTHFSQLVFIWISLCQSLCWIKDSGKKITALWSPPNGHNPVIYNPCSNSTELHDSVLSVCLRFKLSLPQFSANLPVSHSKHPSLNVAVMPPFLCGLAWFLPTLTSKRCDFSFSSKPPQIFLVPFLRRISHSTLHYDCIVFSYFSLVDKLLQKQAFGLIL